jgi:hypothetical protein
LPPAGGGKAKSFRRLFFSGISEADYLLGRRFDLELTELGAAGRKFYQENS